MAKNPVSLSFPHGALETYKRAQLEALCVRLGISPVGSRKAVIKRLRKAIPEGIEVIPLDGDPKVLWDAIKNAVGD